MAGILPSANTCCDPCEEPTTTAVPGPQGEPGTNGTNGTNGVNAYTAASTFIMPAELANVTVTVADSTWMVAAQVLWAQGGGTQGTFEVQSKPDSTHVILKNLESTAGSLYPDNSAPGAVFPNGTGVSPAGRQGTTGSSAGNAPNDATYVTITAHAGLTSEVPLDGMGSGVLVFDDGANTLGTTPIGTVNADIVAIDDAAFTNGEMVRATANGIESVAAAAARTSLGLGTMATQAAGAVAITGGTISGITDLAVADGGTGASTASGARVNLAVLAGYGLIGYKDAIDLNAAGSDNAITMLSSRYRIDRFTLELPSAAVTTATFGMFTAAGGAGTSLCADQALSGTLTATTKIQDLTKQAIVNTDERTEATLYARVGTAEGAARTVNLRIYGWAFNQT